jgi:glycosyltransferase involved in cell wall biosynthesis
MIVTVLTVASAVCAVVPALLFCVNLRLYREPGPTGAADLPALSVLIPARDEEAGIEAAVTSVLKSVGIEFEVVVMDDSSADRTREIVAGMAATDPRIRLERASPLPPGWNGKQHACWLLAHAARYRTLCFVDADVRLTPDALAQISAFSRRQNAALVSGFPRQITETCLEWLLLPLIHFVLLGFLPITRMRNDTDPAFAAGCGQFMLVNRDAYFKAGGHAAIRTTMHDGLLLPRMLRSAGYRTDLADLTKLATCRMYSSAQQVWHGLAKNATEGLGAPTRIVPASFLLALGQVMPILLLIWLWPLSAHAAVVRLCLPIALIGSWLPRALAVPRFRQDWRGALLHPVGVFLLIALQWYALIKKCAGRSVRWKQRSYATP